MIKKHVALIVLTCATLATLPARLSAQGWSSFQNGGSLSQQGELPTTWSPEKGISWKQDLAGYGQSSPIIFEDNIYITSVSGDNKETLNVQALSKQDGQQKWIYNLANSAPEKNTPMVSRAAPSPVADENGVIAFFEGGNLVALDDEGKLRWKRDLKEEFGALKARHGLAGSLEQNENHIFVWCERMEGPFVLAINKADGETAWKVDGLGSTSWSSPRMIPVSGESHLVLSAIGVIAGFNPADGSRLWEFRQVAGNSSSTPVPVGDGKFLMGASGGRDGGPSEPSCGVVEVKKTETGYSVGWKWTAAQATCSFGSPLAHDGRAYFVNRTGIVHCHDLETGEKVFAARLPAGQIWSTPLASNKLIYFFGKDGMTSVVKPGP